MRLSRRTFVGGALGAGVASTLIAVEAAGAARAAHTGLASLTGAARPIGADERRLRIAKVQDLMGRAKVAALLVESGATLDYFTGVRWWRSERTTVALIPASGNVLIVTPAFEAPSVRETLQVDGQVRVWNEQENPFALIVQCLRQLDIESGTIAVEPTVRFFIVDGVRKASSGYEMVSGDGLIRSCRLIKSPAELALLQLANDVTLAALRFVHRQARQGMSGADLGRLMDDATRALGGEPEFSLALLNEASAYPHGSKQAKSLREGSVVLMDCGCAVHGYQSDISRTWVVGKPTARQRRVWDTVKRGQEVALENAKPGVRAGTIDDAVRRYYEREGWGPEYRLPGLPHRTGHGIGLDGHEPAYLVHGDDTEIQAGMCFSDEPGIYIPGEFGIRLEDCWTMTETGPKLFTPLAKSLADPL